MKFELLERGDYRVTRTDPQKRLKLALFTEGGEGEIVELLLCSVSLGVENSDFTPPMEEVDSLVTPAEVNVQAHRLVPGSVNEVQHFNSFGHAVEILEVPIDITRQ